MRSAIVGSAVCLALVASAGESQIDQKKTPEKQIEEALSAIPESMRDGATVLGFGEDGSLTVLREGTSDIVCRADDPSVRAWIVHCYPKALGAFVDRSEALRKEGKDTPERVRTLAAEIAAGTIVMPEVSALYTRMGNSAEETAGVVILHVPGATRESTGLPTLPTPGWPWLAEAGTAMANIRIAKP